MRELGLKTGISVLEIGMGWGRDALWFASSGCNIVALDIGGKYCKAVKENFKRGEFWNDNAVVLRADGQNLPFKENSFDLVFCKALLHHVPNIRQMITEMHRVLKRNGAVAVLCEPNNLNPLWHIAKFLTRSLHFRFYILAPGEFTEKEGPLVKPFCHWQLAEYFRQTDFNSVESGCTWLPLTTYSTVYFRAWLMLEKLVEKTVLPCIFGQPFVIGKK